MCHLNKFKDMFRTWVPTTSGCICLWVSPHWTRSISTGQSDNRTEGRQSSPAPFSSRNLCQFLQNIIISGEMLMIWDLQFYHWDESWTGRPCSSICQFHFLTSNDYTNIHYKLIEHCISILLPYQSNFVLRHEFTKYSQNINMSKGYILKLTIIILDLIQ